MIDVQSKATYFNNTEEELNEFKNNPECGMIGNKIVSCFNPNMGEINKIYKMMNFDTSFS